MLSCPPRPSRTMLSYGPSALRAPHLPQSLSSSWKTSPTPWHCKPLGCLMCPQEQVPEDKGFKLFTGPGQSLAVSGRLSHRPPAACMAPETLPATHQTNNGAVLEDSAASAPIAVGGGTSGHVRRCHWLSQALKRSQRAAEHNQTQGSLNYPAPNANSAKW